jgi:quinol monooxygenase YgiN
MTIAAILEMTAQPGRRDDALAVLLPGLADTRAFDGNLAAEVLLDEDPDRFLILERWESASHNDAYQGWRQTPEGAIPGFGDLLAGQPTMRVYPIAGS